MNDYECLMLFIRSKIASATPSPGEDYRDLHDYLEDKLDPNQGNDRDDVKDMVKRALSVAKLSTSRQAAEATKLDKTDAATVKRRTIAATLLAMAIIRDTSEAELKTNLARLEKMNVSAVLNEMLAILTKGDRVISTKHPKLTLKNFTSAGTRSSLWMHEAEDAYSHAHELLLRCEMRFLVGHNPLVGSVATAFASYFGDANATINTSTLKFGMGGQPTWTKTDQTRLTVVREVLRRVCRNIVRQNITIYFGGKSIDTGTYAYVSGKTNPTKIHLGGAFFTRAKSGMVSEAGTIVHECSHTFARTKDHAYRQGPCQSLVVNEPEKALSNADNYRFFVEAAFG